MRLFSGSPHDTKKMGEDIGRLLDLKDVVVLIGELGVGKTTLIQGICKGLNVKEDVLSPSFIIIGRYSGKLPVYHIDLYRLNKLEEMLDLGIEEIFYEDGVNLIEWGEKAREILPQEYLEIAITQDEENSIIELIPHGGRFCKLIKMLKYNACAGN